ncbi:hypothetical protein GCM10010228_18290 [Streptomyces massasporeus]|nr:hypothetical protein GCM10010228_18290 [Streptomyces massasporeus]
MSARLSRVLHPASVPAPEGAGTDAVDVQSATGGTSYCHLTGATGSAVALADESGTTTENVPHLARHRISVLFRHAPRRNLPPTRKPPTRSTKGTEADHGTRVTRPGTPHGTWAARRGSHTHISTTPAASTPAPTRNARA